MALYLVQHGKALPKDVDPEKGLSDEGAEKVELTAKTAAGYSVKVGRIEHSGKKRAKETAEILAKALNPDGGVKERDGIAPMDDVTPVAKELKPEDDLMLVGHLPFMEKLASFLITGSEQLRVMKFQNGGIVCLDKEPESGSWHIKWTLMPEIS